jgi:hypothetical protein
MRGKKLLADLAILGGALAFTDKLLVGRPNIGDRRRFLERVNDLLDRRWLTNDVLMFRSSKRGSPITSASGIASRHVTAPVRLKSPFAL